MKYIISLFIMSAFGLGVVVAQDLTTIEATDSDISDNLDLEAVASIFADAEDLEDFEHQLNDPEKRISNLDLNEDGYVDYLRVIEAATDDARVITIQSVIGKDLYQDVATIDVEKDDRGKTRVQVVGDVYMYGPNYVIEPVYVHRPRIFVYLWTPRIRPWCSAFYWGFYPSYFHYWRPYPYHAYYSHVHHHHAHQYYYRSHRRSTRCASLHKSVTRKDYASNNPKESFTARNEVHTNRRDLVAARPAMNVNAKPGANPQAKPVNTSLKPVKTEATRSTKEGAVNAKPANNSSTVKPEAQTKPAAKPTKTKPAESSRPSVKPSSTKPRAESKPRSSTKPRARTNKKPNVKPRTKPRSSSPKPNVKPSPKPKSTSPRRSPSSSSGSKKSSSTKANGKR
jgi:hypothetical protein